MRHKRHLSNIRMLKHVDPLPPWHPARSRISIYEVKAYIRKLYNIGIPNDAIDQWAIEGVEDPMNPNKKIYLKVHKFCGAHMVHKTDLIAFCEAI